MYKRQVLAKLDDITVLQEMLFRRLTIDQRSIGAIQIFKEGVIEDCYHRRMLATDRQIIDLDIVACLTANTCLLYTSRCV